MRGSLLAAGALLLLPIACAGLTYRTGLFGRTVSPPRAADLDDGDVEGSGLYENEDDGLRRTAALQRDRRATHHARNQDWNPSRRTWSDCSSSGSRGGGSDSSDSDSGSGSSSDKSRRRQWKKSISCEVGGKRKSSESRRHHSHKSKSRSSHSRDRSDRSWHFTRHTRPTTTTTTTTTAAPTTTTTTKKPWEHHHHHHHDWSSSSHHDSSDSKGWEHSKQKDSHSSDHSGKKGSHDRDHSKKSHENGWKGKGSHDRDHSKKRESWWKRSQEWKEGSKEGSRRPPNGATLHHHHFHDDDGTTRSRCVPVVGQLPSGPCAKNYVHHHHLHHNVFIAPFNPRAVSNERTSLGAFEVAKRQKSKERIVVADIRNAGLGGHRFKAGKQSGSVEWVGGRHGPFNRAPPNGADAQPEELPDTATTAAAIVETTPETVAERRKARKEARQQKRAERRAPHVVAA